MSVNNKESVNIMRCTCGAIYKCQIFLLQATGEMLFMKYVLGTEKSRVFLGWSLLATEVPLPLKIRQHIRSNQSCDANKYAFRVNI